MVFYFYFLSSSLSLSLAPSRPRRQSWNRVNRHISYLRVTSVRIYREEIGTLQFCVVEFVKWLSCCRRAARERLDSSPLDCGVYVYSSLLIELFILSLLVPFSSQLMIEKREEKRTRKERSYQVRLERKRSTDRTDPIS